MAESCTCEVQKSSTSDGLVLYAHLVCRWCLATKAGEGVSK